MKTLIITSHPSSKGFTHRIAKTFAESGKSVGKKVEVIDLYKTDLKQDFLRFEDAGNFPPDNSREIWQKKIGEADELVIVFPLWWFDSPAILKNWFDNNFTSGFAYKMQKSGIPLRLLKGKIARVFITADGLKIFYWLLGNPFRKNWVLGRLKFCGYKVKTFEVIGNKRKRSENFLKKYLLKVAAIAKQK